VRRVTKSYFITIFLSSLLLSIKKDYQTLREGVGDGGSGWTGWESDTLTR